MPQIVGASSIQTGQGRRCDPFFTPVDPANRKRGRRPREETSSRQNESFPPPFTPLSARESIRMASRGKQVEVSPNRNKRVIPFQRCDERSGQTSLHKGKRGSAIFSTISLSFPLLTSTRTDHISSPLSLPIVLRLASQRPFTSLRLCSSKTQCLIPTVPLSARLRPTFRAARLPLIKALRPRQLDPRNP